ncbi:MAG: hypothetical protein AAFR17_11895 [Pseudomonadota bacterium]
MSYEYKAVGGPEKGRRKRGAKSRSDRVAAALEDILAREAVEGWEYLRTDLIPVEERRGWLGRSQEIHRAVLVFRRQIAQSLEIEAKLEEHRSNRRAAAVAATVSATEIERPAEPDTKRDSVETIRAAPPRLSAVDSPGKGSENEGGGPRLVAD